MRNLNFIEFEIAETSSQSTPATTSKPVESEFIAESIVEFKIEHVESIHAKTQFLEP